MLKKDKMILGLSNGSLLEATVQLLKRMGISVNIDGRNFFVSIKGTKLFDQALLLRPQDIPEAVIDGVIDAGICGWDCVVESGLDDAVAKIVELPYGRCTNRPVRIVIFGKTNKLHDRQSTLVTAEYPVLAKRFFKKAKIRFSHGSTEAKVAYSKYDFGVGVVESGRSLTENGLQILRVLLESPTVLIAGKNSLELSFFGRLLRGGLKAESSRLLKMNVMEENLESILKILPSIQAPTVSRRADGGYALETVAEKDEIVDLIYALECSGASGVLVQDINVVV